MAALPTKGNLDGSTAGLTTGMFQVAIGSVYDYLSGLFGTTGTKAEAQKVLGVAVVDRAYAEQVGYNVLSATIPVDNSIPLITEGTQILAGTVAPKTTTNRLRVRVQCPCSPTYSGADGATVAVFVNGVFHRANVVSIAQGFVGLVALEYEFVPGTTSPQTVTVRLGCGNGGVVLGGNVGNPYFSGAVTASLVVEEITA